jgi:hypothetical protein
VNEYDYDISLESTDPPIYQGQVLQYSGVRIPQLGERVAILINELGAGAVVGYYQEYGWLGLIIRLDQAPEWHRFVNKGLRWEGHALVFGLEIVVSPWEPKEQWVN